MKLKSTYKIEERWESRSVDGVKHCKDTKFYHEEIDIDEICYRLARIYRFENSDADDYVSVECTVD